MPRRSLASWLQYFFDAYRRLARTRCTTHCWTVAAGPDLADRLGQALEPVAAGDADVLDAAVAQLGQDAHPGLGALAAGARPQAQHVPLARAVDAQRDAGRPVRHAAVLDPGADRLQQPRPAAGARPRP